jgi:hypothetical protein
MSEEENSGGLQRRVDESANDGFAPTVAARYRNGSNRPLEYYSGNRPTALERAFELARTGKLTSLGELRTKLKDERYLAGDLEGPSLIKQLRALIKNSRSD